MHSCEEAARAALLRTIALILFILLGISLSFIGFAAIFALEIEQPSLDVYAAIEIG